MKKILTIVFTALVSSSVFGQTGMGIGNTNPQEKLDVTGAIKIGTTSTTNAGTIRWNGSNFQGYDGSQWVNLDSQGGAGAFETTSNVTSNSPGTIASDDFVFGSSQLADDGNTAHDHRMFFDKSKGAFRAGAALSTQWDAAGVGDYSLAGGINGTASGVASLAFGNSPTASGNYAIALGNVPTASALLSIAMGDLPTASGQRSVAIGVRANAQSYGETVMGINNTTYSPASTTAFNASDRLFVIGNGSAPLSPSNALTIYKNGKMNINDAYDMPTADGTNGQVMTTNGSGVVSWQTPSDDGDWTISSNDMYNSNSGNIGIGTSSPDRLFNIESATGPQLLFTRDDNTTTDGEVMGEILFDNNDDTAPSSVDAAAVIRSTASGAQGNSNKGGNILFLTKNSVAGSTSATERMRVAADGNVGIGTTNPSARLEVMQANAGGIGMRIGMPTAAETTAPGIRVYGYSPAIELMDKDNVQNWYMGIDDNDGNKLVFGRGYGPGQGVVQAITVDASDRVGIGNTAPNYPLDVSGSIRCTSDLRLANGNIRSELRGNYFLALQGDRNMVLYDGAAVWSSGTAVSDIRTKTNIRPLEETLPTLMKLSAIRFQYKPEEDLGDEEHIGVIAQEILEYYPDMVYHDTASDRYIVYYEKLTTVLLKGIQEQQQMIEQLQDENADLKSSVNEFKAMASDIEQLKQWTKFEQQSNK